MTPPRLNQALLTQLSEIARPRYDRTALGAGIVHIGVGNFHRAHQALYTDDVLNEVGGDWGIIGASLRSATAENELAPQDALYTVNARTATSTEHRIVGSITRVITAATEDGYAQLLRTLADSSIHVVTLTVTEKGYCHAAGGLDQNHPDIRHDLASSGLKRSLPGILSAALQARRQAGGAPISLLSCDNLAGNGQVLRRVVIEYAQRTQPDLLQWIEEHVSFPSTMVDRIVPATTAEDRAQLIDALGFADEAMVCCEPFSQWVIEDRFCGPRPAWERAGALLVDDVAPFENAKLRLLNGPHSASAYLGVLSGYDYIHQVMDNPTLSDFVGKLVDQEILPEIATIPGFDLSTYVERVFERFANSGVAYATRQVATDGSQKLPQRLVPVLAERLAAGRSIDRLALVIAAWINHLQDPAPDPLGELLQRLYQSISQPEALVEAICEQTPIFDALHDVRGEFQSAVATALGSIHSIGLAAALQQAD